MSRSAAHHPSTSTNAGHAFRRNAGLSSLISRWLARRRQRRDLRELAMHSDHLLRDIGLVREEALSEAAKPFWR